MVSRITGTVGKGLAAITMDKDYQQKRREEMNRPTKDFGESLAKGGMGFLKVLNTSSYAIKHQRISLSILYNIYIKHHSIGFSMNWLLCLCSPSGSGWWSNRNCDQTGRRYGGLLLMQHVLEWIWSVFVFSDEITSKYYIIGNWNAQIIICRGFRGEERGGCRLLQGHWERPGWSGGQTNRGHHRHGKQYFSGHPEVRWTCTWILYLHTHLQTQTHIQTTKHMHYHSKFWVSKVFNKFKI